MSNINNIGETVKRFWHCKWARRSAIAIVGAWAFFQHQFRTDPLSYFLYPIRSTTFEADESRLRLPRSSRNSVGEVAFSEDGQSLFLQRNPQNDTTDADNLMRWNIETGRRWIAFDQENNPLKGTLVDNFAISNDERWIVMSQRRANSIQIRDADSGKIRPVLEGEAALMVTPTLSEDGTLIAGVQGKVDGRGAQTKVWSAQTGQLQQTIESYGEKIALSPSGESLAIARGPSLELWDLKSNQKKYTVPLIPGEGNNAGNVALALFFSADGQTISVQKGSCQLQQLEAATGKSVSFLESRQHASYYAPKNGRQLSADGKTFACYEYIPNKVYSSDETSLYNLNLIDVATETVNQTVQVTDLFLDQIAFSFDDRFLATSIHKDAIAVHQLESGQIINTVTIENYGRGIAFSPDNHQLLGIDRYGSVAIFDPSTGKKIRQAIQPSTSTNVGVDPFLGGNGTLMTLGSTSVTIWDNQGSSPQQRQEVPIAYPAGINRLSISPQGDRFATMGYGNYWRENDYYESTLVVGSIDSGEVIHTIHNNSLIYDTAFSPDGKTIATIHRDNTAHLWDAATGKELYQLDLAARFDLSKGKSFPSDVGRIGFSPDGETLITSNDVAIQLWQWKSALDSNSQSVELLHTLKDGTNGISFSGALDLDGDFAISPNGKWIAASKPPNRWNLSRDNRIYLWNVQTGRLVRTFVPNTLNPYGAARLRSLDFSPDGTQLVGNDELGRITIWTLPKRLSIASSLSAVL